MQDMYVKPTGVVAGRKALIVDDHELIRAMMTKLLLRMGFDEVAEAADGSDALKRLDREAFDIIVCDINMAPMGGIDFVRTLRSGASIRFDAKRARTPVLFLTGSTDKDHILGARGLGVKDYLLKPIDPEKMRARIIKMFS